MERSKYSPRKRREAAERAASSLEGCPAEHYDDQLLLATLGQDERFQRYVAGTPEIASGIRHVVTGDGPSARFIDFVVDDEAYEEYPYAKFRRSIEKTFQVGWRKMEAERGAELVGEWRDAYHELVGRDQTVEVTNVIVDEKAFEKGVELGSEMSWYIIMVTLAALKEGVTDPDDVRDIAVANAPLVFARSRKNVAHTFGYDNYYNHIDCGAAYLNDRGGLVLPYRFYREGDPDAPEPAGKTVGCVADLVKINPGDEGIPEGDEFSALQNCVFACINKARELGLFDVQLAFETWELCKEIDVLLEKEMEEMALWGIPEIDREKYALQVFHTIL